MTYAIVCAAAYFGIGLALLIGVLWADKTVTRNQVAPLFIALLLAGPFVLFALLVDKMRTAQ